MKHISPLQHQQGEAEDHMKPFTHVSMTCKTLFIPKFSDFFSLASEDTLKEKQRTNTPFGREIMEDLDKTRHSKSWTSFGRQNSRTYFFYDWNDTFFKVLPAVFQIFTWLWGSCRTPYFHSSVLFILHLFAPWTLHLSTAFSLPDSKLIRVNCFTPYILDL